MIPNTIWPRVPKVELFEGAIIIHSDIDSYTAVVQKVNDDSVDLVDIYAWHEVTANLGDIKPAKVSAFTLHRLGFEKQEEDTLYFKSNRDDHPEDISVRHTDRNWHVSIGINTILVTSTHQLQAVVKALTGVLITPQKPINEEDEEDNY